MAGFNIQDLLNDRRGMDTDEGTGSPAKSSSGESTANPFDDQPSPSPMPTGHGTLARSVPMRCGTLARSHTSRREIAVSPVPIRLGTSASSVAPRREASAASVHTGRANAATSVTTGRETAATSVPTGRETRDTSVATQNRISALPPVVKMLIGGKPYIVHLDKLPFLHKVVASQWRRGQLVGGQLPTHPGDIPYFETINFAVANGFHHFFKFIPADMQEYRKLVQTLDYLLVDVLGNWQLHNIEKELDDCILDWHGYTTMRNFEAVNVLFDRAGEAAVRLLYMIMTGKVEGRFIRKEDAAFLEYNDNPAFRATRNVMANPRLFDEATKLAVLGAYQERFGESYELQMCYNFCLQHWRMLMKQQ